MVLSVVDSEATCNADTLAQGLRDILGGDFGPLLLGFLGEEPSKAAQTVDRAVAQVQSVCQAVSSSEQRRREYLSSAWPAELRLHASRLDAELAMLQEWVQHGSVAADVYSRSLIASAREKPWDREAIARGLIGAAAWLAEEFGLELSVPGWASTSMLKFMMPTIRRVAAGKIVDMAMGFMNSSASVLRYVAEGLRDMDAAAIAQHLDGLAWHLSHFLRRGGPLEGLLGGRADKAGGPLGRVDQELEGLLSLLGDWAAPNSGGSANRAPAGPFRTAAGPGLLRALERIQELASRLLEALNDLDAAMVHLRPSLLREVKRRTTVDLVQALQAVNAGNVQTLSTKYVAWVEMGWRERCPFRRDDFSVGRLAQLLNRTRLRCPFYRGVLGGAWPNATKLLQAAEAFVEGLDLSLASGAAGLLEAWLREHHVATEAANITHKVLSAAQRARNSTEEDGGQASRADNATQEASPEGPFAGAAATLAAALRAEYLDLRGHPKASCTRGNEDILDRRLLVTPLRGEAERLLEFLAVELAQALTTWRLGPWELRNVMCFPLVQATASYAAGHVLELFTLGFADEAELEAYAKAHPDKVLAGLVFTTADGTTGNFPPGPLKVEYSMRFHAQLLPQTSKLFRGPQSSGGKAKDKCAGDYPYYASGFTVVQELMGRAVARLQALRDVGAGGLRAAGCTEAGCNGEAGERVAPAYNLDTRAEQFPQPGKQDTEATILLKPMLPAFIVLALLPSVCLHVKDVVYEKQERLRDLMRMMGLKTWVYWLGLPLFGLLQLGVLVSTLSSFRGLGGYLVFSDPILISVLLWLFALSTISLSSLISAFFCRAKVAAPVGGIVYVLSYLPSALFNTFEDKLSLNQKNGACLFSNTCLSVGLTLVMRWEREEIGAQWSNLATAPPSGSSGATDPAQQQTLLNVFSMLLLDSVLYLVLAGYVEKVLPGLTGLPQPWYFPITSCLRFFSRRGGAAPAMTKGSTEGLEDGLEYYEAPMEGQKVFAAVCSLSKVYGSGKRALRGVSFDMHQGTIMGLLGHNGAGKSTAMAIMSGFYPPTSGDVIVNGISVCRDAELLRRNLGICLQHSALYDELSAHEHLWLFGRIKGDGRAGIREEVDSTLQRVQLLRTRHAQSRTLSAGTKRCLSIGCALIGGSEYVILDEPTAGIDASSRREMWKLLMEEKQRRTMLLSTHFMDEADVLCDRIAVLREGRMVAIGSSVALKRHFSGGYSLRLKTTTEAVEQEVTKAVLAAVPSASYAGAAGRELRYELPLGERGRFPRLFSLLQDTEALARLCVMTFDVSAASLEAVLQQAMGPPEAGAEAATVPAEREGDVDTERTAVLDEERLELIYGWQLHQQQFAALLQKRLLLVWRDGKAWGTQMLLPAAFAAVAIVMAMVREVNADEPPLRLNVGLFGAAVGPTAKLAGGPLLPCSAELANASLGAELCRSARAAGGLAVPLLGLQGANSSMGRWLLENSRQIADSSFAALSVAEAQASAATVTLWFGTRSYHALPAMVNLWNRVRFGLLGMEGTEVSAWSHPLPGTQAIVEEETSGRSQILTDMLVAMSVALAMSFIPASFVVHLVHEKATKSKRQQLLTGVSPVMYWLANYAWDVANFLVPMFLCVVLLTVCQLEAYSGANGLAVVVLMLVYCFAVPCQMYCAVPFFSISGTAYATMICLNMFTTNLSLLSVALLELHGFFAGSDAGLEISEFRDSLATMLQACYSVLLPNYCLAKGLVNIANNHHRNFAYTEYGICMRSNDRCFVDPLDWEVTGKFLAHMALTAPLWMLLVLLIEYRAFPVASSLRSCSGLAEDRGDCRAAGKSEAVGCALEDQGVADERAQVRALSHQDLAAGAGVVLQRLGKTFESAWRGAPALHAVRSLDALVLPGECFGLLGPNGAGKTTTLRMVCGDVAPSRGDAFVSGHSVRWERDAVRRCLGFCPQFDSLPERLTVSETLQFYARIRGLPRGSISGDTRQLMRRTFLEAHEETWVENLSGGNRRKLSAAVALVSRPPVVLLDEPSIGIDVHARRQLWCAVDELTCRGRTVVLASHSMEECEALCTRLMVLTAGSMRCLGSPARLKGEHGQGYTLTVKAKAIAAPELAAEALAAIRNFLAGLLPDAHFGDGCGAREPAGSPGRALGGQERAGLLRCHFRPVASGQGVTMAQVFVAMEVAMAEGGALHGAALDYVVSQVSLEDAVVGLTDQAGGGRPPASQGMVLREISRCTMPAAQPEVVGKSAINAGEA